VNNEQLAEILNRHVFNEAKPSLLKSIADNPDRFVGVFRSTTPQLKLIQNLLQSREIRFGDAMEEVMASLFQEMGFMLLPKSFVSEQEEEMSCDHYLHNQTSDSYYLIEQKMRDDHDSSKKRGQFKNFRDKLAFLQRIHGTSLVGIMYFIDPSLGKNKNYYIGSMQNLFSELGIEIHLFYNGELFNYFNRPDLWEQLIDGLRSWRNRLGGELDLNFDKDPAASIRDLSNVSLGTWSKLLANESLWVNGVISTLFPEGRTLTLQLDLFVQALSEETIRTSDKRRLTQLIEVFEHHFKQYYPK
jgi:hypothetical protein